MLSSSPLPISLPIKKREYDENDLVIFFFFLCDHFTMFVFSSNTYWTVDPYTSALHYLYINCGGTVETVNGTTYEADFDKAGPSTFFRSTNYWASSSTGLFLDDNQGVDNLVLDLLSNTQLSKNDRQLYTTARLSPSSLTYYAFCLKNRTYNVSLHFAEIQFTDDKTFSSLGRRIFDVYIQVF